jgi:dienelactone hydrolase
MKWAAKIAESFLACGISSFALAYWKTKNTSKTLSLSQIEIVQAAVCWLKDEGYQKVGIYGLSKGAELALVAGSYLPQIEFVIAASPACCVFEGLAKPSYSGASSWTWAGCSLPYISFNERNIPILKNILRNGEFGFHQQYLDILLSKKNEENTIKVEKINGPILLLSAKEDAQWPAATMGGMICDRLKEKQFRFPYLHEVYYPASHVMCPVHTRLKFIYRQERMFPKECEQSRKNALELSLKWISGV